MFVLWLILAALAVLVAVVLVRTVRFTPGPAPAVPAGEETIDRDKAVENLRTLVRCRTVSNTDHALEDEAEFEKLIRTLRSCIRMCSRSANLKGWRTARCCLHGRARHIPIRLS